MSFLLMTPSCKHQGVDRIFSMMCVLVQRCRKIAVFPGKCKIQSCKSRVQQNLSKATTCLTHLKQEKWPKFADDIWKSTSLQQQFLFFSILAELSQIKWIIWLCMAISNSQSVYIMLAEHRINAVALNFYLKEMIFYWNNFLLHFFCSFYK